MSLLTSVPTSLNQPASLWSRCCAPWLDVLRGQLNGHNCIRHQDCKRNTQHTCLTVLPGDSECKNNQCKQGTWLSLICVHARYFPQVWLNYRRKSTIGWSVSNAMTDMSGGLFSLAQQSLDAYALKVCLPSVLQQVFLWQNPEMGH